MRRVFYEVLGHRVALELFIYGPWEAINLGSTLGPGSINPGTSPPVDGVISVTFTASYPRAVISEPGRAHSLLFLGDLMMGALVIILMFSSRSFISCRVRLA